MSLRKKTKNCLMKVFNIMVLGVFLLQPIGVSGLQFVVAQDESTQGSEKVNNDDMGVDEDANEEEADDASSEEKSEKKVQKVDVKEFASDEDASEKLEMDDDIAEESDDTDAISAEQDEDKLQMTDDYKDAENPETDENVSSKSDKFDDEDATDENDILLHTQKSEEELDISDDGDNIEEDDHLTGELEKKSHNDDEKKLFDQKEVVMVQDVEENICGDDWKKNDNGSYTRCVEEGILYEFDVDKDDAVDALKIIFTKIDEKQNVGNAREITIKEIHLSDEQMAELGALNDIAYDITSTMENGSFAYDLTLPLPKNAGVAEDTMNVVYVEDEKDLEKLNEKDVVKKATDDKDVKVETNTSKDKIEAKNLDHFTLFVVVSPNPVSTDCSGAGVGIVGTDTCYNTIQEAIDAAVDGNNIEIKNDISIDQRVEINKEVTIEGNNFTVSPTFEKSSNSNNSSFAIFANNVIIQNLIIDGSGGKNLHGINVYQATGVQLNDVTINNNDHTGLVVNGSEVTVENISTSGNEWHGINVDQGSGVTTSARLIIKGESQHTDLLHIYVDDATKNVVVFDEKGQYDMQNGVFNTNDQRYTLVDTIAPLKVTGMRIFDYLGDELGCGGFTSNRTIRVDWDDNVASDVNHYNYMVREENIVAKPIVSEFSGDIRDEDGYYQYRVQAVDNVGNTGDWSEWCGVTLDRKVPDAPEQTGYNENNGDAYATPRPTNELTCTGDATNINGISVHWTDVSDDNATVKYERQYKKTGANSWSGSEIYTNPYTSYRTFGSNPGAEGTYSSQVRAWKDFNDNNIVDEDEMVSAWSNECSVTFDITAPAVPTGLQRLAKDDYNQVFACGDITPSRQMHPDWNDNTDADFSHYEYSSFNAPNGAIGITTQRFDDSIFAYNGSWTPGEGTYGFTVRAVDKAGNKSAWALGDGTETFEDSCQITYDNTAPVVDVTSHDNDDVVSGVETVVGSIKDENNDHYWFGVIDSNNKNVAGPGTVNDINDDINALFDWDTTAVADGVYTIKLEARDAAQNKNDDSIDWVIVIVDNTAPEGTIDAIKYPNDIVETGKFVTQYNTPVILGTASDTNGVSSVMLHVDGKDYAAMINDNNWEVNITEILPDGLYEMVVTIVDDADNTKEVTQFLRIDTVAPRAVYKQFDGDKEVTGTVPRVNDVAQLSFTAEYTDVGPTAGLYQDSFVIFEAQDDGSFHFGQNGKKAFCSWRSSPNLVDITGTPGNDEDAWSFADARSFSDCTATLPDGEYYMTHQVYDTATRTDIPSINQFRDVLGLHFIVDTTAPVVEITQPSNQTYLAGNVTLEGNIVEDRLNNYNLSLNSDLEGTCDTESTWDFSQRIWQVNGNSNVVSHDLDTTTIPNGHYILRLAARDVAGNRDPMENAGTGDSVDYKCITIDNEAPTVDQLIDQTFAEGQEIPLISVEGRDNITIKEFCVTVNGPVGVYLPTGTKTLCDSSGSGTEHIWNNAFGFPTIIDTSMMPEGTYTVDYYVTDAAGNKSDDYAVTYTINNVAPQVTLSVSDDNIKENHDDVVFTASFIDPSTQDAGDNIFDDAQWTAVIDFGDHSDLLDLGTFTDDGNIIIPDHEYNKDGDLDTTLTVCESQTNPTSEGVCTSVSIDMHVRDVETGDDDDNNDDDKTPITVTSVVAATAGGRALDNADVTKLQEESEDNKKVAEGIVQAGGIDSDDSSAGRVAGAETCRSWSTWVWVLLMIIGSAAVYLIGKSAKNIADSKRNLLWQGLSIIGVVGLWFFFDTCRTYMWVPIVMIGVGLVLVWLVFNSTSPSQSNGQKMA